MEDKKVWTVDEAIEKGFDELDDKVQDDLEMGDIHMEYPEVLMREAVERK